MTARLLHFSEDPTIERFDPHVPATNPDQAPGVRAIDVAHAPVYWFPRNCPRGAVWASTPDEQAVLSARFQTAASRVQATELSWLDRVRDAKLFVYEFDPAPFARWPDADGQWIARQPVVPLGVHPVGDLLALHASAGVELGIGDRQWPAVLGRPAAVRGAAPAGAATRLGFPDSVMM